MGKLKFAFLFAHLNFAWNLGQYMQFALKTLTQTFQGQGGAYLYQIELITESGVRCGPYGGGGE